MHPIQHSTSSNTNTQTQTPNLTNQFPSKNNTNKSIDPTTYRIQTTSRKKVESSQLFSKLRRIFRRSKRIDEALERRDSCVDLEDAGCDRLRCVLLSVGDISPERHRTAGFYVLEAHPALEFLQKKKAVCKGSENPMEREFGENENNLARIGGSKMGI